MNPFHKNALLNNLPFVLYRKPNSKSITGWFQKNSRLNTCNELTESCFVFAPFNNTLKIIFLPNECNISNDIEDFTVDFSTYNESDIKYEFNNNKEKHIQLVTKGIQAINNGLFEKVVLSRTEKVNLNKSQYELYFKRFVKKYPTAFVYWFYHPKVGMWMGATPEQLVKITNKKVETVALAGTQKNANQNNIIWGNKEQNEQSIVTHFVIDALTPYCENIQKTEPYTFTAGTLLHIKTDISANLKPSANPYQLVQNLHPTPALCGYPKLAAQNFIIENEDYNREFYGGFLGEWNFNNLDYENKTDLFVNLRCMKIENETGILFLGGGINKDSTPESEYNETVNKSKTVKNIL